MVYICDKCIRNDLYPAIVLGRLKLYRHSRTIQNRLKSLENECCSRYISGIMSYICCLCLLVYSVWCTLCCQFLRIVVYGVPYVASFSGSSIFNYPTILSNVYLMCLPPIILICPYLSDKQLLYKRETTLSMKNRIFLFFFFTKVTIAFQFVFAFIQV